ncbi:cytochrome c [Acuticoccus sp. I52.16.1]|uniref:c-type cytochrome n=1 Tax=Acuticoccus sp. I52.16.1 TaxID=2928472 RepID=UPI001FD0D13D|nr:cytochrome c [Acuticoccus sp. I52.16.1]UOM34837.1 cytochrome c [Acuticoccus sp. I52.16.1]
MRYALAFASAAALLAPLAFTSAAAAQDAAPQVERHEIMEEVGDAMGVLGGMAKGERPYDAAAATEALDVFIVQTPLFLELFPEGSETGHDTRAKPAIWEDPADFHEKGEALVAAAESAKGPAGESLEGLRTALGPVGQSCRACHEAYRAPKN